MPTLPKLPRTKRDSPKEFPFDWTWVSGALQLLGEIGKLSDAEGGGLHVRSWSTNELWVMNRMAKVLMAKKLGPTVIKRSEDVLGQSYFLLEGTDPKAKAIELICHADTVKNGGNYDGRLGFALAASVVRALGIMKHRLRHNLLISCYRGEEADELGVGTVGSSVIIDRIKPAQFLDMKNREGTTMTDLLGREETLASYRARKHAKREGKPLPEPIFRDLNKIFDLDWEVLAQQRCAVGEVHIEQGRSMPMDTADGANPPFGVATCLAGPDRWTVIINGQSGHSGATPMVEPFKGESIPVRDLVSARQDALLASAKMQVIANNISRIFSAKKSLHRLTITDAEPRPGGRTQIAGMVEIHLEIRDIDTERKGRLFDQVKRAWQKIAKEEKVEVTFRRSASGGTVDCDERLIANSLSLAQYYDVPTRKMTCFARHDVANIMAAGVPGFLILTRCPNGSHLPNENVSEFDLAASFQMLMGMIMDIDWFFPTTQD